MSIKVNGIEIDDFTRGYLVCALWSSIDEQPDGNGGPPLDEKYDIDDFHVDAIKKALDDCTLFQEGNAYDLEEYRIRRKQAVWSDGGTVDDYAGHDFWLTRNHHGAGFWDRRLGELGDRLTKCSHAYGSCDVIVGDDGKLHLT